MAEIKHLYKLDQAKEIAEEILCYMEDHCSLITVAGSIRRKKAEVKDIEIIYTPLIIEAQSERELNILPIKINRSEEIIQKLIKDNTLAYRIKKDGTKAFGERVKLLRHTKSQIPVDLFCCQPKEWANNLVSRTGGKTTNITIASHAKKMGWNWLPFNEGFKHKHTKEIYTTKSERAVFDFVNLPYLEPWERP
jgi:DNA polymerase/3'-5' exonuclease PolX